LRLFRGEETGKLLKRSEHRVKNQLFF